jgi:hypothetical protein
MSVADDAVNNLQNIRQKEGETLQDYANRFKTACNVLKTRLGGPMIVFWDKLKDLSGMDESAIEK